MWKSCTATLASLVSAGLALPEALRALRTLLARNHSKQARRALDVLP